MLEASSNRLRHLGHGVVTSAEGDRLSERLLQIHRGLAEIIAAWRPDVAAVEETFVNRNPVSTLKLGQVRGVVMLAPALAGLSVHEYAPNMVKKSVVGSGHAEKAQMRAMVHRLLPGIALPGSDAADALAIAICHAHNAATRAHWPAAMTAPRVRTNGKMGAKFGAGKISAFKGLAR
jgi:crossover junction endodeoxyribonuclease RuvC